MNRFRNNFLRLIRSEEGNVIMIVGIAAFMLLMAVGTAVDMTRAQTLQAKISTALDAAGLIAGNSEFNTPSTYITQYCGASALTVCSEAEEKWVQAQAEKYFKANFPAGYLGASTRLKPTTSVNTTTSTVTLSATTTESTTFMSALGVDSLTVSAQSTISRSVTSVGLELVLALDNTGSMATTLPGQSSSKIAALMTASNDLFNIISKKKSTLPENTFIGVVPFGQTVNVAHELGNVTGNIGANGNVYNYLSSNPYAANVSDFPELYNGWYAENWNGCVMARSATATGMNGLTYDISEDAPSASKGDPSQFVPYFFPPSASPHCPPGDPKKCGTNGSNLAAQCDPSKGVCNSWASTTAAITPSAPAGFFCPSNDPNNSGKGDFDSVLHDYSPYQTVPVQCPATIPLTATQAPSVYYTRGNGYSCASNNAQCQQVTGGPNYGCPEGILPLSHSNLSGFESYIWGMGTGGDTTLDLGMAWAWRLISPNWNNMWPTVKNSYGDALPLPYNYPNSKKSVVFMTDGMNHFAPANPTNPGSGDYTSYGYVEDGQLGTTDATLAAEKLDARTLSVCNAMKAQGITIYTVGFGQQTASSTPTAAERNDNVHVDQALLQACSSTPDSACNSLNADCFIAPTNAQLVQAFQIIASYITNVYISK